MFEEYLRDAAKLYDLAKQAGRSGGIIDAKCFYRSAIFHTASAMEAYIGYIGDTFSKGDILSLSERSFLNDRVITFDPKKGRDVSQARYFAIEDKAKFVIRKFAPQFDIGSSKAWDEFMQFKEFRDLLTHPKQQDDDIDVGEYARYARSGFGSSIELMNVMSIGVFKSPLRTKLRELVPD
ncbi:MAG: hypothetical protein J5I90_15805 [Caldilineales bacterium]|nr:hypothetical protein [Caldilineales bacterium]